MGCYDNPVSENEVYSVILVRSISQAIHIEGVLKENGITIKLIPVPRHLNSDCGSAVRISKADRESCEGILAVNDITPEGFADLKRN